MNEVKNKKVLIVGGSSGFGFQSAKMLLKKGATVVITGRNKEKLDNAIEELEKVSYTVSGKVLDVSNEKQLQEFFKYSGAIDYIISMVGGFMGGGFLEAPYAVIKNAIEEKLFVNIKLAQHAAHKINDYGCIIFTAGVGGRADNASGAIIGNEAVNTLVKGLAVELSLRKIRVNAVAPSWTKTPLWRNIGQEQIESTEKYFSDTIPLGRTATIEEISSAYIFLIENSFITGQTIIVDGGLSLL